MRYYSITAPEKCFDFSVIKQACGKYALMLPTSKSTGREDAPSSMTLKHIKCPTSGKPLLFNHEAIGCIAAMEWNATPWMKDARHARPCTNLHFRADTLDDADSQESRKSCIDRLCSFIMTDLLLHWEQSDGSSSLANKMNKYWQPILDKISSNLKLQSQLIKHYHIGPMQDENRQLHPIKQL